MKFFKSCLVAVLSVFLLGSSLSPANAGDIPQNVVDWSRNNVMLVDPNMAKMFGSGFWIDNETMISACHVITLPLETWENDPVSGRIVKVIEKERAEWVMVSNDDLSVMLEMEVVYCNDDNDIAIFKRKWLDTDSEFTAFDTPGAVAKFGQEVWCSGFGLSIGNYITVGHFQGPVRAYDTDEEFVTCPSTYGDSGSPAFVVVDGQVQWIGIRQSLAMGKRAAIPHLPFIRNVEAVNRALATLK